MKFGTSLRCHSNQGLKRHELEHSGRGYGEFSLPTNVLQYSFGPYTDLLSTRMGKCWEIGPFSSASSSRWRTKKKQSGPVLNSNPSKFQSKKEFFKKVAEPYDNDVRAPFLWDNFLDFHSFIHSSDIWKFICLRYRP